MPTANDMINNHQLKINLLIYGKPKTKKTWWSLKFAEIGFNIIHLCIDEGGYNIAKQISKSARDRIFVIDLSDKTDMPVAPQFFTRMLKQDDYPNNQSGRFFWNENNKTIVPTVNSLTKDQPYIEIDISKTTRNDILILDSWTSFCWGLTWKYALETKYDFSDVTPDNEKRPEFGWTRHFATWTYKQLQSLPCHLIIIAHEDRYEKRKQTLNPTTGKMREEVEWIKTQIKSTSANHAIQMPADFEMLYFLLAGNDFYIDSKPSNERDGGTRTIPPALTKWQDLSPSKICDYLTISTPINSAPPEAFKFYNRGDAHPQFGLLQASMEKKKIINKPPTPIQLEASNQPKPTLLFGKPSKPSVEGKT